MIVVIQVFDFLFGLVEGLKGEAYIFSEFEASILFPCLVEKVCHISIMQLPNFLIMDGLPGFLNQIIIKGTR